MVVSTHSTYTGSKKTQSHHSVAEPLGSQHSDAEVGVPLEPRSSRPAWATQEEYIKKKKSQNKQKITKI
jgi:hypothetical protein